MTKTHHRNRPHPVGLVSLLLALLTGAAGTASAEGLQPPYSWRGINGTGTFPAGDLVTSFAADADGTGKNICWRATLPNWGANSPVVVGDRVFLMCQEGVDIPCPQLLCFDVTSGKKLWQQPVDHLDAWPEAERTAAKEIRAKEFHRWSTFMTWWHRIYADPETGKLVRVGRTVPEGPPSAEVQALLKQAEAEGWRFPPWHRTNVGGLRGRYGMKECLDEDLKKNNKLCFKKRVYRYPGWTSEGPFWGSVMGSVVSDGKHIYAVTALDGAACYDLDGKLRWVTDLESTHRSGGGGCHFGPKQMNMASPVLVGDRLVYHHRDGWETFGLDTATGEIVWRTPAPMEAKVRPRRSQAAPKYKQPQGYELHMGPGGTPVVMVLGGTTVVVTGHGLVLDAQTGKSFGIITMPADEKRTTVDARAFCGSYASWVVDGDVVYAHSKRYGLAALRLRLEGGSLVTEPLWQDKKLSVREGPNLNLVADTLFVPVKKKGFVPIAADTGQVRGKGGPSIAGSGPGWAVSRDGVAVYRSGGKHGVGLVFVKVPEMTKLGDGSFVSTPTSEQEKRNIGMLGIRRVNGGPGGPMAWGNRVFYRNNHYLWCIGDPDKPWVPPEKYLK